MPRRQIALLLLLPASLALPACSDATKPPGDAAESPVEAGSKARRTTEPAPDVPVTFESPDGRFKVRYPGDPTVSKRPADPKAGTVGEDSYALIRLPRTYIITCTHLAEPRDAQKEIQRMISESQGRGEGLKVLESKDLTLKGHPGKDTTCTLDGGDRLGRERFVVDGKDLYHVISIVPNSEDDAKAAAAFVESFELLKD